jgi:hypothetical protein
MTSANAAVMAREIPRAVRMTLSLSLKSTVRLREKVSTLSEWEPPVTREPLTTH